jgi:hypothetical protein
MLSIATRDLFWTTKFRRQRLSALSILLSSTCTFSSAAKAQSDKEHLQDDERTQHATHG